MRRAEVCFGGWMAIYTINIVYFISALEDFLLEVGIRLCGGQKFVLAVGWLFLHLGVF